MRMFRQDPRVESCVEVVIEDTGAWLREVNVDPTRLKGLVIFS